MSSGFVSAGTDQEPVERNDEWHRVQQELEEERRRKAELGKQDGGKSLFEVLQQNKMAKQEAFEEKIKLKNQFRSLDEDEVDFLDSILESTRAKEAAVKKETAEGLELFRRQREEAEKTLLEDTAADVVPAAEGEDWKLPARKRRREKSKDLLVPGKKRKSLSGDSAGSPKGEQAPPTTSKEPRVDESLPKSTSAHQITETGTQKPLRVAESAANSGQPVEKSTSANSPVQKPAANSSSLSLGLAGYSSDSE
ncbi:hypothetical protein BO86DRAFT_389477 [Aspergillus japonicus CBS 114.51]|uniref:FAM192A/Fyv6 N-terminal domain-containing protein n=2 Tax=Aspergillus TaxID=5052 RepID=A0A2V5GVZ7_ASPV1|nr:hypothetical protein BO86DRAFT_389477 [Aspergillus japonicus CBS 114.51]PYI13294.1 hypothetical protein BO99DRAFT_64021 [Aspergillus violaceofuscus CBS 115571]RAH81481.1 hypothetical protein BO86DRAFT_389477 [Aspergillus japonicus CBS 114.51]